MNYIDSRGKALEPATYAAALLKLHGLGVHNQIDEHDIAGEEALEDQQVWQQTALDTLSDFVSGHGDDLAAIAAEVRSGDGYPRSIWTAERDMDPTDPLCAIKIVFDMAQHGALDPEGPDAAEMEGEIDEQQQALDMTLDLLGLHADRISAMAANPSPSA